MQWEGCIQGILQELFWSLQQSAFSLGHRIWHSRKEQRDISGGESWDTASDSNFLIGTTGRESQRTSHHFFGDNQSSALSRKISCTWTAAENKIWSYSRRRNHHRELSNFWLVKLGGLGLSSQGAMNEGSQIEASKIIFEKVWRIYEVLDPGKSKCCPYI